MQIIPKIASTPGPGVVSAGSVVFSGRLSVTGSAEPEADCSESSGLEISSVPVVESTAEMAKGEKPSACASK
jgi:hypothetical protein